jgi:DNA-binding winged helix-turn-helix (wHTH) protein
MTSSRSGNVPAVRIEPESELAWCGAERLALMPRAFAVLRHLVDHAGRLVTKDALLAGVCRDAAVSDAALTTCIRDLRRALGDSADAPRYIETVHRRGFRFIGPIARPAASPGARGASDVPTGTIGTVPENAAPVADHPAVPIAPERLSAPATPTRTAPGAAPAAPVLVGRPSWQGRSIARPTEIRCSSATRSTS